MPVHTAPAGVESGRDLLMVARAAFFRGQDVRNILRPTVIESWMRCREHGLDPGTLRRQQVDPERLRLARSANTVLMRCASDLLELLHARFSDVAHVVALSDEHGYILSLHADDHTLVSDEARASNIAAGVSWNERDIGSNPIGTCLVTGQPVAFVGGEHFYSAYADWTCVGMPIHGATGEVTGALHLSFPIDALPPQAWGWMIGVVRDIEANLARWPEEPARLGQPVWDAPASALLGLLEILVAQANLPSTFDRFVDDVRRSGQAALLQQTATGQKLRQTEERFRKIFEHAVTGIAITDWQGRFVECNPAYTRITGYGPADLNATSLRDLVHVDDRVSYFGLLRQLRAGEIPYFTAETRYVQPSGEAVWVQTFVSPLPDERGEPTHLIALVTDVTERHDSEVAAREALDVAAQAQHTLEARVAERTARLTETVNELEHFSYALTHDMRAPLRAIQGFGQLLLERYAERLDDIGRDYLRRMTEAAVRMDHLVLDALDYSKTIRGEMPVEPVEVCGLLAGILESYPVLQPFRAHIHIHGPFPKVWGNQAGLVQCFSNLLSNAVKFVAPGSTPEVHVTAEIRADMLRVTVADNGIGIAAEQQERVFDMFQRLNRTLDGTGIGLALVRKVVERMNGRVGVDSEPGQGSRFWVELYLATEEDSCR